MMTTKNDFASTQEALDFVADHPTMDELMSRRSPYPRTDIRFLTRVIRDKRTAWADASAKRAEKKEDAQE